MISIDIKDLHLIKSIVAEDKDKIRVNGISWGKSYISEKSPWKCIFSMSDKTMCYSIIEYDEKRKNYPCDTCSNRYMNDQCKLTCCDYCRFTKWYHCETCER